MEYLITTKQAADMLGISVPSVRRLIYRGTLGAIWVAGRHVIDRRVVAALRDSEGYQRRTRARAA